MCGRTSQFLPKPELESRFDAEVDPDVEYRPRYNIAPSEDLEVVTNEDTETIEQYHWGLIPFWSETVDDGMINARSETAHEKRPFQRAWESRPCLVLSTGFYEWKAGNGGPKQPYRVFRDAETPAFAMAGLWEETEINGDAIRSVTILTTEPNDLIEPIHDRMPVVLPENDETTWLESGPEKRRELCQPYPDEDLDAYPISTRVNSPSNDDATVIEPADSEQSGLDEFEA